MLAGSFGRIEHQGRTNLADRSRAVAFVAGELEDRGLIEVIAGKMFIDVAEYDIALQEWCEAIPCARNLETGIDGVGKRAGVTQQMTGRHAGCVGHREGRK